MSNHMRYLYKESDGQYYKIRERKLTKKDLWNGLERNIVCFDIDAKPGELTERLLDIMKDVAFNNQDLIDIDTGEHKEAFSGYHFWVGNIGSVDESYYTEYRGENSDITVDERLAEGGELHRYYTEDSSGSLTTGDNSLVVMFLNNGEILLGSY